MLHLFLKPADHNKSLADPNKFYDKANWIITLMHYQADRDEDRDAKILQPVLLVEGVCSKGPWAYFFYVKKNNSNIFEFCYSEGTPFKDIFSPEGPVCFVNYDVDSSKAKKLIKHIKKKGSHFAANENINSDIIHSWFKKLLIRYFDVVFCPDTYRNLLNNGGKQDQDKKSNFARINSS